MAVKELSDDVSGIDDPVTFSVILSRFRSIVNEMTLALERSAWSSILALARDFSCALYDASARQVAMHEGLPIHTTAMHLVVESIAEAFDSDVHPGDVFLCNDPYSGNTHVGDLVTAAPVFAGDRLVFWSVAKGHQSDTGAFVPSTVTASTQSVWQEGLQIPPLRLVSAGAMQRDVLNLYLANMRYRDLLEGDLLAQLGSIERGRQRLVELCEEYGADAIVAYADRVIDYADRRMADEIRAMPDGRYTAEGWLDSDGFGTEHIPVRVTVTIDGDRVHVDYTGSADQVKGGINGTLGASRAAATIPFLYYIDPDIPHNHGCIARVDVFTPEGSVCNASHPASTSCATVVPSDLMQDVINKALVAVMPERVPAGSTRAANTPTLSGDADAKGEPWGFMLFNGSGAQGAARGTDGWPTIDSQASQGGVRVQPIEQLELLFPIRIEQYEIEPESMGYGAWLGGPGTRLVVRPLNGDMTCIAFGDGCANPPHGARGGTAGIGGGHYVEHLGTGRRRYVSSNGSVVVDGESEIWTSVSTGGGGFGPPWEREVEQLRRDARDGLLSRDTAREVFGVVLSDDEDPSVDADATAAARRELSRREPPMLVPTVPDAATWVERNLRDDDVYLLNPQL